MILAVLVTFIICWTPQQATLLWDVYRDPDKPVSLETRGKGIRTGRFVRHDGPHFKAR